MAAPTVGAVVLVRFPFSDLTRSKLRPAIVLADVGRGDYILGQITSNQYADPNAIELRDEHLIRGSLRQTSYIRPGKLFTANEELIVREVAQAMADFRRVVVEAIEGLLRRGL